MANSTPVSFQPAKTAKAQAKQDAATIRAEEAAVAQKAPEENPEVPVAGASFTPARGKKGVYHALPGTAGIIVPIVTH